MIDTVNMAFPGTICFEARVSNPPLFIAYDPDLQGGGDRTKWRHLGDKKAPFRLNGLGKAPWSGGSSKERRSTEWLWLGWSNDPHEALLAYADTVRRVVGLDKPGQPPSVYCSWYYAHYTFNEDDLHENLDYLCHHPIPLEVIQIDDCWNQRWGDWEVNHRFPSGMAKAVEDIRKASYTPGLWTCPYLAEPRSEFCFEHSDWLLRRRDGSEVIFRMSGMDNYVIDPTRPGVLGRLETVYRRLRSWGFAYHKLDFMRAVALDDQAAFFDQTKTRAEAYRMGREAVRRDLGDDAYILHHSLLYAAWQVYQSPAREYWQCN